MSKDEVFTNDAINKYNSLFYSCVNNAFKVGGVADFFTKIEPMQIALARSIRNLVSKKTIRVKELGSGPDLTRWKIISETEPETKWEVVLTDFSKNVLPDIKSLKTSNNLSLKKEVFDVLKLLPKLKSEDKFDVFLTTYGFDSVWFPDDMHLEKQIGNWYQAKYKLAIDKKYHRYKLLSNALQKGYSLQLIKLKDFKYISIKKRLFKVNINDIKYGKTISEYYSLKSHVKINFPGGMINKIIEAFEKQIAKGGIFIIGDMAVNSKQGIIPPESRQDKAFYMDNYHTSGKVAKFKIEDYGLAKKILGSEGFKVNLDTVESYIHKVEYEIPLQVKDHLIMSVHH